MSTIKTVYVTQYDYFWSFTAAEWLAFVKAYLDTEGHGGDSYILAPTREVKRRPRTVSLDDEGEHRYYSSTHSHVRVVHPLDWGQEEFQCELEYLTERGVR